MAVERGDVFVLGLKRATVGAESTAVATGNANSSGQKKAEEEKRMKDEEKEDRRKKEITDLTPLGGSYELMLVKFDFDTGDMLRVLGVVYRKFDEDKVSSRTSCESGSTLR